VQTFPVVDLFQGMRESIDRVLHGVAVAQVDLLVFQRLDEVYLVEDLRTVPVVAGR
jgi:hypothetical protein